MQITLAFLGGIIPAIIWVWFWLKEDKINPEPKRFIIFAFIAGMVTALIAILAEQVVVDNTIRYSFISLLLLASIEEIFKYLSAYIMALKRDFMNEPVDAVIYMLTVALGFAAMENTLYLWDVFVDNEIAFGIILTNMRFIGATILHTASSGIIGVAIALSFYKKKAKKILYLTIGIILSIGLHTGFNSLIISSNGENIFKTFILIWIAIMFLLFFIEKIKQLKPLKKPINN